MVELSMSQVPSNDSDRLRNDKANSPCHIKEKVEIRYDSYHQLGCVDADQPKIGLAEGSIRCIYEASSNISRLQRTTLDLV